MKALRTAFSETQSVTAENALIEGIDASDGVSTRYRIEPFGNRKANNVAHRRLTVRVRLVH